MASRSLVVLRTRKHAQARIPYRVPSVETISIVFALLLILFLWMHLLLAAKIESMGHQSQTKAEQLQKLERDNAALRKQMAETASQANLSRRALELGYGPQTPIYLLLTEPLAEPSSDVTGERPSVPANGNNSESRASQDWPFLSTVARALAISPDTDTVP